MKKLLFVLVSFVTLNAAAQTTVPFDAHAWKAPYTLQMYGWGIERFLIPIEFAPGIAYKGVEDIRFTPGWADVKSPDYWAYAFLWYLDGSPGITSDTIEKNLEQYYDGLIGRNIEKRKIPQNLVTKTVAKFAAVKPEQDDLKTFTGTITMLDYMAQKPMVLNAKVHVRKCPGADNTIVFHQLSPKPVNAPVWVRLNGLWNNFKCEPINR